MIDFGLIPISTWTLRPNAVIGTDLYCWTGSDSKPRLLAEREQVLSRSTIDTLLSKPELKLYIDKAGRDSYQAYLRAHMADVVDDPHLGAEQKAATVSEVVRDVLNESFAMNQASVIVDAVNDIGKHMSSMVSHVPIAGKRLCNIMHHDYGTFTHSSNVGFFASLLAHHLGYSEADTMEIAVGGLLHDLGKLDIDQRILNKPGKLDEIEFRAIKTHPLIGFRRLVCETNVTRGQMLMAYQHHERIDGRGYPVGISGNEIDDFAKICAVADVFEALTSNRPYRTALSAEKAIEIMRADEGKAFDKEILNCWIKITL